MGKCRVKTTATDFGWLALAARGRETSRENGTGAGCVAQETCSLPGDGLQLHTITRPTHEQTSPLRWPLGALDKAYHRRERRYTHARTLHKDNRSVVVTLQVPKHASIDVLRAGP